MEPILNAVITGFNPESVFGAFCNGIDAALPLEVHGEFSACEVSRVDAQAVSSALEQGNSGLALSKETPLFSRKSPPFLL